MSRSSSASTVTMTRSAPAWRTALLTASRTTASACTPICGGTSVSIAPANRTDGTSPQPCSRLGRGVQQEAAQARRLVRTRGVQVEDGGADLPNGFVEILHRLPHAPLRVGIGAAPQHALELKPGGEQPLDDLIVQIPRDPVAIGEDVELPRRTVLLPQLQRERDLLRE